MWERTLLGRQWKIIPCSVSIFVGIEPLLHLPKSENGKRQSSMASLITPLMVKVLQISRKCWRCALASSCAFPQNWLACTILIRAGLSLNPLSPKLTVGLVQMLAVVGAENSWRVLLAMASNSGVKLCLIWFF